ncbi:hypothetical protein GSI_04724 [Ganoderma sinense ZZ0214-1]|uniref:Uncharacterized protein n=1 Tax=Ganoderma sinense ZZ0214-1 TaxID=1077348 RepID=A0A2G8SHL9_9APHY|nr:hypothetical protein GSI_04724 [Ganoderma sinense ZZ0214-1]
MTGFRAVGDTLGPNYARREGELKGGTRQSMDATVESMSGIPGRKMRWTLKAYFKYVYLALRLKLVGWPHDIPFMNLSDITGLTRISRIATLWESGRMYFAPVTDEEYLAALVDPLSCAPGPLHHGFAPDLGRCDIKKRKYRPKTDPLNLRQGRYIRNRPKSARWVSQMAERRAEGRELSTDPIGSFSEDEGPSKRTGRGARRREIRGVELEEDPIEEW